MTSVVRYVQHTMDGGVNTPATNSTGSDYQLIHFDVTTTVGIDAGANRNVLQWTGSGKIKSIIDVRAKVIVTGEMIPMGAVAQNTHALITLDATNTIINISILDGGAAIPAASVISLLLVIGNY